VNQLPPARPFTIADDMSAANYVVNGSWVCLPQYALRQRELEVKRGAPREPLNFLAYSRTGAFLYLMVLR
jgi:hypothetical protein